MAPSRQGVPRRRRHQSERGRRPGERPDRLLTLARKELIRPDRPEFAGEDAFRFRHLLIRDAAYQAMPKEQRAELHDVRRWLTEAARDRMAEYEEILATTSSRPWCGSSVRSTMGACTGRRAVEHSRPRSARTSEETWRRPGCSSTAASRSPTARDRVHTLVALAELLPELGAEFREAHDTAVQAVEAADAAGDAAFRMRAELVRNFTGASVDPTQTMAQARDETERLLAEAERLGDADVRDRAVLALTQELFFLGQTAAAMVARTPCRPRAGDAGRDRSEIAAQLVANSYFGATPVQEAFDMLDRGAGSGVKAPARGTTSGARRGARSRRALRRGARILRRGGSDLRRAPASRWRGGDEPGRRGDPHCVEDASRTRSVSSVGCTRAYSSIGETGFNSTVCAVLANVLNGRGRFDEAETFAQRP